MKPRKWTIEELEFAAKTSTSIRQVLNKLSLKPAGGNYTQVNRYLKERNIDIRHFKGKGWNKGFSGRLMPRIPLEVILVNGSSYQSYKLKKRLFVKGFKKPECEECGWAKQAEDGRIPLELDHINGNSRDNRLENLRILCPNCHSLKSTHRGLNQKLKI